MRRDTNIYVTILQETVYIPDNQKKMSFHNGKQAIYIIYLLIIFSKGGPSELQVFCFSWGPLLHTHILIIKYNIFQ